MTTAGLPGFSKKGFAHTLQISKAHIGRLCPHLLKDFVNSDHDSKISIVILNVNSQAEATSPQSAALLVGLPDRWVARMVGPKGRMRGFFALAKPRNPLCCLSGYKQTSATGIAAAGRRLADEVVMTTAWPSMTTRSPTRQVVSSVTRRLARSIEWTITLAWTV